MFWVAVGTSVVHGPKTAADHGPHTDTGARPHSYAQQ
jgi:hypothetical protein